MPIPYLLLDTALDPPTPVGEETFMSCTFVAPSMLTFDAVEFTPVSMVIMDGNGDVEEVVSLSEAPLSFAVPSTVLADGQMVMIVGRVMLE